VQQTTFPSPISDRPGGVDGLLAIASSAGSLRQDWKTRYPLAGHTHVVASSRTVRRSLLFIATPPCVFLRRGFGGMLRLHVDERGPVSSPLRPSSRRVPPRARLNRHILCGIWRACRDKPATMVLLPPAGRGCALPSPACIRANVGRNELTPQRYTTLGEPLKTCGSAKLGVASHTHRTHERVLVVPSVRVTRVDPIPRLPCYQTLLRRPLRPATN
jgi:hypothetical protein